MTMTTFVGAEYVIANILIAEELNYHNDSISIEQLMSAISYIQNLAKERGIAAEFCVSYPDLMKAIDSFSDYFNFNNQIVSIAPGRKLDDLKSRFIGYLPLYVISFLVDASKKAVTVGIIS